MTGLNQKDLEIWNRLFADVPLEWKLAQPTEDMHDCVSFFREHRVKTVLDVGCGIGIWSMFLSKLEFEVKGYDFSPKAIEFAQKWAAEEDVDIEYVCDPVTSRPFPDEKFDGIIAAKVLDNISEEELEIAKGHIQNSLKTNGVFFCLFNPEMTEDDLRKVQQDDNPTKGITHILYRDADLKRQFAEYTLLNFKTYEYGFRGLFMRKA